MKHLFQRWPFWSLHLQMPEQNARWWAECFTFLPAVEQFIQVEGSAALLAGPGNGKTTATTVLGRFDNFRLQLEQQQDTLSRLWYAAIPSFGCQLKRYTEKTAVTTNMSAWWWRTWQRTAWHYTPLAPERQGFLQGLIEQGWILKKVKWNRGAAQGLLGDGLALVQAICVRCNAIGAMVPLYRLARRERSQL